MGTGKSRLNPRTTPMGILLIAGLPVGQAVEAVKWLDSPAIIRRTIRAELDSRARGAVLAALGHRLERVENMKGKVM